MDGCWSIIHALRLLRVTRVSSSSSSLLEPVGWRSCWLPLLPRLKHPDQVPHPCCNKAIIHGVLHKRVTQTWCTGSNFSLYTGRSRTSELLTRTLTSFSMYYDMNKINVPMHSFEQKCSVIPPTATVVNFFARCCLYWCGFLAPQDVMSTCTLPSVYVDKGHDICRKHASLALRCVICFQQSAMVWCFAYCASTSTHQGHTSHGLLPRSGWSCSIRINCGI